MVRNVLSEYNERNGDVGNRDCRDIAGIQFLNALERFDEREVRNPLNAGELGEVNDLQSSVACCKTDYGEQSRYDVACENTDDERDHLEHLLAVDGAEHRDCQCDEATDDADISGSSGGVAGQIADSVACEGESDDRDGRSDDDCRHDLIDPLDTDCFDDDCQDYIDKACEGCADDQACITGLRGDSASERCEHGSEESEGASEEDRAGKFREEQIDQCADACAEQSCCLAHAVADDRRDSDRCRHDSKELLQCEQENLSEFRFVLNVVDQIHNVPPSD